MACLALPKGQASELGPLLRTGHSRGCWLGEDLLQQLLVVGSSCPPPRTGRLRAAQAWPLASSEQPEKDLGAGSHGLFSRSLRGAPGTSAAFCSLTGNLGPAPTPRGQQPGPGRRGAGPGRLFPKRPTTTLLAVLWRGCLVTRAPLET